MISVSNKFFLSSIKEDKDLVQETFMEIYKEIFVFYFSIRIQIN